VAGNPLEDVRERQERQHAVSLVEHRQVGGLVRARTEPLAGAVDVRAEVLVREHHAFRLARRPGGVDERREVVEVALGEPRLVGVAVERLLAAVVHLREREDVLAVVVAVEFVDDDDELEVEFVLDL